MQAPVLALLPDLPPVCSVGRLCDVCKPRHFHLYSGSAVQCGSCENIRAVWARGECSMSYCCIYVRKSMALDFILQLRGWKYLVILFNYLATQVLAIEVVQPRLILLSWIAV